MSASPPQAVTEDPAIHPARRRAALIFLAIASAGVGFAINIQIAINANYAVDVMNLSGGQQGHLEAIRESCGITAVGLLALLAGLAEPLVGVAVLIVMGVGLGAYAYVPSYGWLIVASVVWSQGFHIWVPLPNSMTLGVAEPDRRGRRLGQIGMAGAVGGGLGLLAGYLLGKFGVPIRSLYYLAGGMCILAAGACLAVPRNIKTPGPRLVFRRRYGLYYLLSFLEGWRKQVVLTFASYLLVRKYGASMTTMLTLWMCIQAICWAAAPLAGKLVDRWGERRVLIAYYICLAAFFVAYAFLPVPGLLYAVFILDGSMFVFSMALTTLAGRLAPAAERTATLSMGVAMNHVAAVAMPLSGAYLWEHVGPQWVFVIGATAAALSIMAASHVPPKAAPVHPAAPIEPAALLEEDNREGP